MSFTGDAICGEKDYRDVLSNKMGASRRGTDFPRYSSSPVHVEFE